MPTSLIHYTDSALPDACNTMTCHEPSSRGYRSHLQRQEGVLPEPPIGLHLSRALAPQVQHCTVQHLPRIRVWGEQIQGALHLRAVEHLPGERTGGEGMGGKSDGCGIRKRGLRPTGANIFKHHCNPSMDERLLSYACNLLMQELYLSGILHRNSLHHHSLHYTKSVKNLRIA